VTLYELVSSEYRTASNVFYTLPGEDARFWKEDVRTQRRGLYASEAAAENAKEKLRKEYLARGYEPYGIQPHHLERRNREMGLREVEIWTGRLETDKNNIAISPKGTRYYDGERIRWWILQTLR